jgi:hypothetical protein
MVRNFLSKVFKLDDSVQDASRSKIVIHTQAIGSAGTASYAGYPTEEYLQTLQGTQRADIYDKMRRSDGAVKMCLSAVKSPIKSAVWEVHKNEDMDDQTQAEADAELVKHILFKDMEKPWGSFLGEALGFVDFGHSVFEVIDKVVLDHPKFGSYNGIKALAFRSQKTIERWNLDPATDTLASISQYAYGDLQRLVDIPAEVLLIFTLEQEGANYEGISALRCCYGSWFRKNHYLKMNAIGIEKFAIPTPIVTVPEGKESGEQFDNMIAVLENYTGHQKGYITMPSGWEIDLNNSAYDPTKVETSIDNEDKRMVKSFMANFLELGLNGFGSQSLSFDLSDFFLGTLDHLAGEISSTINQKLITRIVQMNRGPRQAYPYLKHSGISDRAGQDLANLVKGLVDGGVLTADDVLEAHMRKRFGLPAFDPASKRSKMTPPATSLMSEREGFYSRTNKLMEQIRAMRLKDHA